MKNPAEIRELFQMRDCLKVKETSGAARKIENALLINCGKKR